MSRPDIEMGTFDMIATVISIAFLIFTGLVPLDLI